MNDDIFTHYTHAGVIANKILHQAAGMVREGVLIAEVVETAENAIIEEGAGIAFPLNISRNEAAAHDTARYEDDRTFAASDLVKVDLGVHVEGYIADTALTVDLGKNDLLVEASRAALDRAIAMVRPGVTVGEIGASIQEEIESRGYRPVANLTGHGLGRFLLHEKPTIPNIGIQGGPAIEEGMVFAIEPFATTGSGYVSESPRVEIFQQTSMKPVRLRAAKKVLNAIRSNNGLPFAKRMLPQNKVDLALSTLRRQQILHAYPVLHDVPGSLVSQAEHTLIVTEDGCVVTTA
ncbi:MAG: type II methionyl aminopeptidase [Methanomicrobiaceae archaeon]|nr:type II methionyl aminopeptidase [Methanomicrobiaceae archaeon]